MIDTMANYFKGYGLIKYLEKEAETGTKKVQNIAKSLRIIEIKKWVNGGREEAEFLQLVQLIKWNSNPLESSSFPEWANRVKRQYETEETAYKGIFDRLVPQFENENALVVALNALDGLDNQGTLAIAKQLLDYQYKEWNSEGKTADDVFNNLKPYLPESNIFSSPAFSAWSGFVKSTFSIKEMQPNVEELQEAFKKKLLKRKSPDLPEHPSPNPPINLDLNKPLSPERESPDSAKRPSPKQPRNFDLNEALPEPI